AILGAAGGAYVLKILANAPSAGFKVRDFTWYQYFFTECRAIWSYLRLFALPFGQNIDHDFPISRNLLQHGALLGLIGLAGAIWAAWHYRDRYRLACFGFFVFLLLLAPTSSVVPILDPLVERRLYLPVLGLLLILFDLLRRSSWGKVELSLSLALVLGVSAALTYQRTLLWSNPIALWRDAAEKAPRKARTHFWLAYSLLNANDCQGAVTEYQAAAKLLPLDVRHPTIITAGLLENWGLAYRCAGLPKPAIEKLDQAARIRPTSKLYAQIGMMYGEVGDWKQATEFLQRALTLDPNYERAYVYLGNLYLQTKQPDEAARYYLQAVTLDPADQYAANALVAARYKSAEQKRQTPESSRR
ncbi:MAG: tetratricopeptide repeat protein, partial [Bryobacteraceae bacterium]